VLDLDIVLWQGGAWRWGGRGLEMPHRAYRQRSFRAAPAAALSRSGATL
jgi:2-amino-4-hydroxy-6-hydroxymethyldihydropteridine diphosphokinase